MTNYNFTAEYDFSEHSAGGSDVRAGWIVVVLVNLCVILLTV
jgi:hypothetical protein